MKILFAFSTKKETKSSNTGAEIFYKIVWTAESFSCRPLHFKNNYILHACLAALQLETFNCFLLRLDMHTGIYIAKNGLSDWVIHSYSACLV